MAGIMDLLLKGLGAEDSMKDYQHASRIFVDSNMLRSPKYAFMFYVVFDYNDSVNGLVTPMSKGAQIGALCKSAQLPKYTIDHQVHNAYNRPNITQKRIKYDPVTLKFHDDSDDIIREFWYDYMSYFYRDSDYSTPIYAQSHKYTTRQKEAWGYGLRTQQGGPIDPATSDYRPLKAIRIYSFYRKRFSEYMLINPVITSFRHGEHTNEGSGLLEHEMTITYESVKYSVGYVSPDNFGDSMLLLYDMTPSMLSAGGTKSIFGTGGLIQTIDNTINDLASGNYAAAFLKINRAQQTFKGTNLSQVLKDEGLDIVNRAVRTGYNPLSTVNAPTVSSGLGLGLLAVAAGGLSSTSSGKTGKQNELGPQVTIAKSVPSTTDQASPVQDFRAVSGGQVVAQTYKPVQQQPQFPQLATSTTTIRTGTRTPTVTKTVAPGETASQNINLNKSSVAVSGRSQGTPAKQTPPDASTLLDTDESVIGLSIAAALSEREDATDVDRINRCNTQIQHLSTSQPVQHLLANDYPNKDALDALVKNYYTPGYAATVYGSEQAWETAKAALITKLEELETPAIQNTVAAWTQLKLKIDEAVASGDKEKLKELLIELSKFGKTLVIRSAYKNLLDMVALSNDIASIANGDAATAIDFDITKYWIKG